MKTPSSREKPAPGKLGNGCAVLVALALTFTIYKGCSGPSANVSPPPTVPTAKPMSKADTLKAMTANINDIALQPLDRKYDPEGYAKVGKRVWATSNELRRWAGLAALQNNECKSVTAIALWERATRSQLSWHVVCGNDERYVITEAQARAVRAKLDPDATAAERKKYTAAGETAQPMSAAFANFKVDEAVVACDNMMREAAVDKGSFDPAWSWNEIRNEETGQAVITKEYSGKNAMGGTLSGKYECVVDAPSNRIVYLTARDALGQHIVYE